MKKNVLLLSADTFGRGEEELGKILIKSYIATLIETNTYQHIILVNSGVKLVCEGSTLIDDFKEIEQTSKILICGTCLSYYELEDKVMVGEKSNMIAISQLIADADKVVNL